MRPQEVSVSGINNVSAIIKCDWAQAFYMLGLALTVSGTVTGYTVEITMQDPDDPASVWTATPIVNNVDRVFFFNIPSRGIRVAHDGTSTGTTAMQYVQGSY